MRRIAVATAIAFICWNCAQQGSPSGGPRDTDPPVVLECVPANYSTGFHTKKIAITFDEYIVLDNVNQELVVSPPMEEKPTVRLRKKTLIVQFEEDLRENTTYTFNFGSAIKDLHEGNKLLNYEYVFSTGDVLDSLSVKGTLKNAFDLSIPGDPVSIMLYTDLRDSAPLLEIPQYIGRSDDSGVFSVNNLKADIYKVFALKDGNRNFLFDLPTEEIGFLDTSLQVNAEFFRSLIETETGVDSVPEAGSSGMGIRGDTTGTGSDSTVRELPDYNSIFIEMELFTEDVETQYLMNDERPTRRHIQLVFARPLTDSFSYRFLVPAMLPGTAVLADYSAHRDSLDLWLLDSLDYQKDTLVMELGYTVKDTTNRFVTQTDTLKFTFRERTVRGKKGGNQPDEGKLVINTLRNKGRLELNGDIRIDLNQPLASFNDSLIDLWQIPDSVEVPVDCSPEKDTGTVTRGWIRCDWESQSRYRLRILPGGIQSVYEANQDTIDINFTTRDVEYYGQILLTLENVHHPVIIQLMTGGDILRQEVAEKPGKIVFSYLLPRDYTFKFIHDLNGNGAWDTGSYLKKLQPEPVEFLPKQITVRSNWDHDVTMALTH